MSTFSRIRSSPRLVLLAACALSSLSSGCHRSKPDFGTFPRVVVPLGEAPEPPPEEKAPAKKVADKKVTSDAPDPPPIITKDQIDYVLRFDKGEISLLSHTRLTLALKAPSDRRIGRFAFEFFVGTTLIERVRFDFPLLGAGAPKEDDALEQGLTAEAKVRVPFSPRATSARVLDRKTRNVLEIPWPPAVEDVGQKTTEEKPSAPSEK